MNRTGADAFNSFCNRCNSASQFAGVLVGARVVAVSGDNPNLSSEDGRTYRFGVVLTPSFAPGLTVSLDYYDLSQNNLVISPTAQAVISGLAPGTVVRGPNVGGAGRDILITALKVNGESRDVRGIDFAARYQTDFGSSGNFAFDLSGTRLIDYKTDLRNGSGAVQQAGTYSSTFGGLPRWKLTLGPTIRYSAVTASIRLRHVGGYADPALFGFAERRVNAENYIDLTGRLDLGENGLRLIPGGEFKVGVTDLFDKRPPFVRSAVLFFGDGAPWDAARETIL